MTRSRRALALATTLAATLVAANTALGAPALGRQVEVHGVGGSEMLKLRSGPGLGYRVIVGLPEGSVLRNHGCDRVGGTPWCKVSLKEARGLKGYVSGHYLKGQ